MIYIIRPKASRVLSSFYINLGITLLYSHIKQVDTAISFIDLAFEDIDWNKMENNPPQLVLMSLFIDDFREGLEIISQVKERFSHCVSIVGGPHVTLLRDLTFIITDLIDYIAVGDSLNNAIYIIHNILKGKLPQNRIISCTQINSPIINSNLEVDYSLWRRDHYFSIYPVELSRGCYHQCPYCSDPVLRNAVSFKRADTLLQEITRIVDLYGGRYLRFVDSSLISIRSEIDRLLEMMRVEKLPVQWSAYSYPNEINEKNAQALYAAGCRALFLGLESLSASVTTGKRLSKAPEKVKQIVGILQNNGIQVHCNFIIGLPGETYNTVLETMRHIKSIKPDSIGGGPFYLTPGSMLDRRQTKFGIQILDRAWVLKQHEKFYDHNYNYFRTSSLTQVEMRKLAQMFTLQISGIPELYWNMSDYSILCWLSIGGTIDQLKRIWKLPPEVIGSETYQFLSILREKETVPSSRSQYKRYCSKLTAIATNLD